MSVSKNCKSCFNWQEQSGINYGWTACQDSNGNATCAPCDESGGYHHPQDCLNNIPAQLPMCSQVCYPQCSNCTANNCTDPNNCMRTMRMENYNNYGEQIGPKTYLKLDHTWLVQKPYTL